MKSNPVYITRAAYARQCGVHPTTINRWARDGKIQYRRNAAGHLEIESTQPRPPLSKGGAGCHKKRSK